MTYVLSRFICSVWLLLFNSVLVFAVPNAESPSSTLAFGYDRRVKATIAYDQTAPPAFDYDCGPVLSAHEKENLTEPPSAIFAKVAGFLAAKGAPVVIGETMTRVEQAASKIPGSKILNGMPDFRAMGMNADEVTSSMRQYNRKWILEQMRSGRPIIDIAQ